MKKLIVISMMGAGLLACDSRQTAEEGRAERSQSIALTGSEMDAAVSSPVANQAAGFGGAVAAQASAPPRMTMSAGKTDAAQSASPGALAQGPAPQVAPSMLIRNGSSAIEVRELDPAIIRVRQLAAQLGGYVANSSISGGRDQVRSATLELKIPAARYDQAVGGLTGIGKVEAVNTSVEDVGEEFVDISARTANSKRLEERLVTLLATRTGRLEDVLAVERELARVREEIERYEGRIRFLKTRAAVSTLAVTVHEPYPILGQSPGDNPLVTALKLAWRNFVRFIAGLIASLGVIIPIAAILAGLWYGYRRIKGRRVE